MNSEVVAVVGHLIDHRLEAVLELAAVLRARDHAGQVENHQPLARERLRHLIVDDPLGDALRDRRLSHAGVADQHRVVLRAPGQDLDRLLDLIGATDHRIQLALPGRFGEVATVLVERLRLASRPPDLVSTRNAADHGSAERRVRQAEARQQTPGVRLRVPRQRQQHVLGSEIRRVQLAHLVVRPEQRGLGLGRKRRRHVRPSPALRLVFDLRRDRGGITVGVADDLRDEVVLHCRPQQVLGVEIEGAPVERQLRRAP